MSALVDMITISNTILQFYRYANKWIQKKQKQCSTYHLRYQRFHRIDFIRKQSSFSSSVTLVEAIRSATSCLLSLVLQTGFIIKSLTHQNQKSFLKIFRSIESFPSGITTKKYSSDGLSTYLKKNKTHSFCVFTLRNVVKHYEYDVITWSSAVKLRAQLEPVSFNGGRTNHKSNFFSS